MPASADLAPRNEDTAEVVFDLDELFFSRTDSQFLIQSGDRVFRRICGCSLRELRGRQYSSIQHPEMPKGLVWLIQKAVASADPVCLYTKTVPQGQNPFWVFAIITPHEGGFISVCFKPSTPMLNQMSELYSDWRKAELADELEPEQSAKWFTSRLNTLGFANYRDFMAYAIAQEFAARARALNRPEDINTAHYMALRDRLRDIRKSGFEIVDGFKGIQTSPKNMRIQSARMGQRAAPLSVISANFDLLADSIRSRIDSFLFSSDKVLAKVSQGLFVNCANSILSEMMLIYRLENAGSDTHAEAEEEYSRLKSVNAQYAEQNGLSQQDILTETASFLEMCVQLRRTLSGLSVTRVMSQIESARIGDSTGGMSEIIAQLQRFQTLTYEKLSAIEQESESTLAEIRQMLANNERLNYATGRTGAG